MKVILQFDESLEIQAGDRLELEVHLEVVGAADPSYVQNSGAHGIGEDDLTTVMTHYGLNESRPHWHEGPEGSDIVCLAEF